MRPPKGFESEKYPLRHRLVFATSMSLGDEDKNTILLPIVMSSTDTDVTAASIVVNPHNANYVEDVGPLVRQMSIIDKMRISMKFAMTEHCEPAHHSSGVTASEVFTGQDIPVFTFSWRPIFNVYPEKLDAVDEDTGTSVATILGLTKDATNMDVVPLTTNKLPTAGPAEKNLPASTINAVQVFGDFNMTTNLAMEDHVFDEDLLQDALRRYTNKGALRSCIGRTRHVTLTRHKPYANFYIDKFLPRQIRRVQDYGFFAIQVHMPIDEHVSQHFIGNATGVAHLGIKVIAQYHEWNIDHDQSFGTP